MSAASTAHDANRQATPSPPAVAGDKRVAEHLRDDRLLSELASVLRQQPPRRDLYARAAFLIRAARDRDRFLAELEARVAAAPHEGMILNNLGAALERCGCLGEAERCYQRARSVAPGRPEIHFNLANAQSRTGRLDDAIGSFVEALRRGGDAAAIHAGIGGAFHRRGRWSDAIGAYRSALRARPNHVPSHVGLATALNEVGDSRRAVRHLEHVLRLYPSLAEVHSALLLSLHYVDDADSGRLEAAHRRFATHCVERIEPEAHWPNTPDPSRRLRVGYVSPDFRQHSVVYFAQPIIERHDRKQFEVVCYSGVARADRFTRGIRHAADQWRDIAGVSDADLARMIRHDGIDILVDLAGHTSGNRLLAFARRPAPVQVTYLGYPDTSGIRCIDYRLVDSRTDPRGANGAYHAERLIRLGMCGWCYRPHPEAQRDQTVNMRVGDAPVFGSFNSAAKLSDQTIDAWSRILNATPNASLLLKSKCFLDPAIRTQTVRRFERHGVRGERIRTEGWSLDHRRHMDRYREITVALDPFPYNGTTTTCEALWMGVPVVALRGERHSARVGYSLLAAVGLHELVATSVTNYVETAVELASDNARLAEVRLRLHEQIAESPLMDEERFVSRVDRTLRAMWRRWCRQQATGVPLAAPA